MSENKENYLYVEIKNKIMELEDLEPDVRDEIKYVLLAVKHTRDDPVLQAYMLQRLMNTYKKYNLKVPPTVVAYLKEEVALLQKQIKEKLATAKK
jgi:hypothetical protein